MRWLSLRARRLPSRRKPDASVPVAESSEARQKFANAKAISSDMFFGRESNAEVRKKDGHCFKATLEKPTYKS